MVGYQLVDCPARHTAVIRSTVKLSELHVFFDRALRGVLEAMERQGGVPGGEPVAFYHAMHDGIVDVEAGFPTVDRFEACGDVVPGELPGGRAVTGIHLGPYETLGRTYSEISAWAIAHGMQPTGEMWEVYLTDPERELDPNRWRTGVFLRVA
jgi:effector-binding domain-containing protein